jgi:hypothetical protein
LENEQINKIVEEVQKSREIPLFGAIEPVSAIIFNEFSKLKDARQKQKLLRSIIDDNNHFMPIDLGLKSGAKTTIAKGSKIASNRKNTLTIAKNLNKRNIRIAFLAESDVTKSADAIIEYKGKLYISDFKHSTTVKLGTLVKDLIDGFSKSQMVVLKVTHADKGIIERVIDELARKRKITGDLLLINKYGIEKLITIEKLKKGNYISDITGFL